MQKPALKNIQHDLDDLIKSTKFSILSKEELNDKIFGILLNTYELLTLLEEKRTFNTQIAKFEKDNTSFNAYINRYKKLLEVATENEDNNLSWRYSYAIGFFEQCKKDSYQMLYMQRIIIASNILIEDEFFSRIYLEFLEKHDKKNLDSVKQNIRNKDLFIELYGLFEGYKLSQKKILKSAGLKIFNLFEMTTKIQKRTLSRQIEYLFASLGENIGIDPKRASAIKSIAEFNNTIIIDYLDNTKDKFIDEKLQAILVQQFSIVIHQIEQAGYKELADEMRTTLEDLDNLFFLAMIS